MEKRKYDGNVDEVEESSEKARKYHYLLSMHIRSFTKQKLETLQHEIDKLSTELTAVKKMSPSDMWINDLTEFEQEYSKVYKK
jgi:ribosomal protein S2